MVVVMSATHIGSTRDELSCLTDFICSSSAVSVSDSCQESVQTLLTQSLLSSAAAVCLSQQRLWDLTHKGRAESAFWNRFQLHELDTI